MHFIKVHRADEQCTEQDDDGKVWKDLGPNGFHSGKSNDAGTLLNCMPSAYSGRIAEE